MCCSSLAFYFILEGWRRVSWQQGWRGAQWPSLSSFELQINQGLLFRTFPFSPRSPRLHKVKVCVHADRPEGGWVGWWRREGLLSLVGLAYNSDRARELKAAQRYDGQAKRPPASRSLPYLNRYVKTERRRGKALWPLGSEVGGGAGRGRGTCGAQTDC